MKPCRDCERPVSSQAFACPGCGAPFPASPGFADAGARRAWLLLGLASSLLAGWTTYVVVEALERIHAGPGSTASSLVPYLAGLRWLLPPLLPLVVVAVWAFWPRREMRGIAAAICGVLQFLFVPGLISSWVTFHALA